MTGYVRQSSADIVPTAVVRAAPLNNEFNKLRDVFEQAGGHRHDGSATEGAYVPLISDADAFNKVAVNIVDNSVDVYVEVAGAAVKQVVIVDGAIVPVTDGDIDLGTNAKQFKDLYITGTANIDSLSADTADINAGTIDATVIGATSAQAITGTLITASTGFVGGLTGDVVGNTTGTHTGAVVGAVTGNVTGNITATTGTSTFNDVVINGGLSMNAGTAATITGLTSPTNATDAATKGYVDTADALKLNLAGGTMSGAIAMGSNKITGVGTPTLTADAATKGYVDTAISNLIDAAPGTLDTLNELAAALGDDPSFATTVANSIATKLPLAGGTMSGAIAMGTNKITGVGTPTLTADAATKGYVDTADALKLALAGGTMSGVIAMGTNKITGVGTPTLIADAATKGYVDTADALKLALAGGTMSGAIAMGSNKITGLGTPTLDADATTKLYVDGILGSATSAATSAAAAAVSASNAATSASGASTSATSASSSATAAAASYDSFDDRYLGSKTSNPTLDNDGNALLTGALYFNSVAGEMRVYSGTVWAAAYVPAATYLPLAGGTITGALTVQQDLNVSGNTTGSFLNNGFKENISGQYYNLVSQADIGTAPNEVPLNQYLGNLAYQDAANIAGPMGVGGALTVGGQQVLFTPAPVALNTTATLTNADIQSQLITSSGAGGSFTLTLPLGTTLDTLVSWASVNLGFDFSVINDLSIAGVVTLAANTGVTTVGKMSVDITSSGRFRIRRTATSTYILYRLA